MTYQEIIDKVAADLGLSKTFVRKVYTAYWKTIREYVSALPLKEELSDEEFLKLRPNVNIPSLGKLYVTLDRYHRVRYVNKKREEYLKQREDVAHT